MPARDVIVVGLGAAGSAALYQLARRGVKALGIDRFHPPHDRGSSHGQSRITRVALGEGGHYVPFVRRSHGIWRELEASTGRHLLHQIGGLIFGSSAGPTAAHGAADFLSTTMQVAWEHGVPHELLSAAEMVGRFPQFHFRGDETGYFEPGAGYLKPEECVSAQLEQAQELGAEVRYDERVLSWTESASGVSVRTERGSYGADRLILCAGPWLPGLVAELGKRAKTYRQTLFWFEPDGPAELFHPGRMPVFIRLPDAQSAMFYGFPLLGSPAEGLKVAGEHFDQPCQPDQLEREVSVHEQVAMQQIAAANLGIGSRCVRAVACQYTVTPDFTFVIDQLPESERIWLASACSGHGFKHSAAVGEALVELALGADLSFDLSPFRLNRPGINAES